MKNSIQETLETVSLNAKSIKVVPTHISWTHVFQNGRGGRDMKSIEQANTVIKLLYQCLGSS